MCGRCRNVFNAFESLKRIEDEDREGALETIPAETSERTVGSPESSEFPALSIDSLEALVPESPPEFTATDDAEFSVEAPDHELPAGIAEPVDVDDVEITAIVEVRKDKARTADAVVQAPPAFLLADTTQESGDWDAATGSRGITDNPLLRTSYKSDRPSRRAAWIAGIVLLLALTAIQATYFFRGAIMESYPQVRPYLVKACGLAGCAISWGRDETAIKIEASDLIESPAKPGRILLTATLVNRGKAKQELPALELRLTDNGNQVLSSRILQPRDYLGRLPSQDEALAPGAELFVNLNFEIANKTPASGYGLRAFYP